MKKLPWWLHFAKLGHSVGTGIALASSLSAVIPYPPLRVAIGLLGSIAGVITHYADAGIAKAK